MANATGYRLRRRNRKLYRRVRSASKWWNEHLVVISPRHRDSGRLGTLMGPLQSGVAPTNHQILLAQGEKILGATMAHAVSAYIGTARLLTFRGGQPLPWSSMVLARTAFEATLRVIWILDPTISDELLIARIGATILEELEEVRKMHMDLPEKIKELPHQANEEKREFFRTALEARGLSVSATKSGKGYVALASSEKVAYPLNIVETSKKWWDPVGVHTYRWLCSFTHAASSPSGRAGISVAAIAEKDVYVVMKVITDSLWKAMDLYSKWIGIPNGFVRRKINRVYSLLESRVPGSSKFQRPLTEAEGIFLAMASNLKDAGLSKKATKNFVKHFVGRLGNPLRGKDE
jgi:hypothetical protein